MKWNGMTMRASSMTEGGGGSEREAKEDDEDIELYRLGQKVKCRIHAVELSEGKVDLSMIG